MTTAERPVAAALAEAAATAGYAPSIHNTQPWRWRVLPDRLELYADREPPARGYRPGGPAADAELRRRTRTTPGSRWPRKGSTARSADCPTRRGRICSRSWCHGRGSRSPARRCGWCSRCRCGTPTAGRSATSPCRRVALDAIARRGFRSRPSAGPDTRPGVRPGRRGQPRRRGRGGGPADPRRARVLDEPRRTRGHRADRRGAAGGPAADHRPRPRLRHARAACRSGAGHDRAASYAVIYGDEDEPESWLRAGEALSAAWLTAHGARRVGGAAQRGRRGPRHPRGAAWRPGRHGLAAHRAAARARRPGPRRPPAHPPDAGGPGDRHVRGSTGSSGVACETWRPGPSTASADPGRETLSLGLTPLSRVRLDELLQEMLDRVGEVVASRERLRGAARRRRRHRHATSTCAARCSGSSRRPASWSAPATARSA